MARKTQDEILALARQVADVLRPFTPLQRRTAVRDALKKMNADDRAKKWPCRTCGGSRRHHKNCKHSSDFKWRMTLERTRPKAAQPQRTR